MSARSKNKSLQSIWLLALGYFGFYIPYSAMTKSLSNGIFPGIEGPISGFALLPAVVIGTFITLTIIMWGSGWVYRAKQKSIGPISIPIPSNKWTVYSGIATAFIIMTTTLAYSFTGISIVFAALLMRGGVLLIAPGVDLFYKRKVHWYSIVALCLSLIALIILFSEKGGYTLSMIAALNIALYLGGYFFRLQFMTIVAKDKEHETNYKFFVEEMIVAMAAIVVIPAMLALLNMGYIMEELRFGFSTLLFSTITFPALIIGALYGCLYIYGTRIYLNKRENTFCIPINRCASLLAGVCASLILWALTGSTFVSNIQLLSAGILIVAIIFLAIPSIRLRWNRAENLPIIYPFRQYLFVCPGNTGRSPMAQAICKDLLFKLLADRDDDISNYNIISAGISPEVGKPMSLEAKEVLKTMNIEVENHTASQLEKHVVKNSNKIFCMSSEHKAMIIKKFPSAALKTICLDPYDKIPNPHNQGIQAYRNCAEVLQELITHSIAKEEIKTI